MTRRLHKAWLKVAALVVGGFGPVFALAAMGYAEPARWTLDVLSWPVDGATRFTDPDTRFLSALTGGFLLGWGVTQWGLSSWAYDLAPEGVRRSVVVGLCAWFTLDSIGSAASGNAANVAWNLVVLAVAVGPMWLPAREAEPARAVDRP